jgi:hypothetical protein
MNEVADEIPRNHNGDRAYRLDNPDDLDGVRVCEPGSRRFAGDAELYDQQLMLPRRTCGELADGALDDRE